MADTKISGLSALGAQPAVGDLIPIVDVSDTSMAGTGTDKKVVYSDFVTGLAASGANTDLTSVYLNNTGLKVKDTNASHGLIFKPGSDITADRTLTVTTGDADRTLTVSASATVSQDYSTSGTPQFTRVGLGTAASATSTNTINLASSGNIVVNDANPKKSIFVHSAGMWVSTTAGSATIAKTETGTNKVNYQTLDFDTTTQEYAEFAIIMPDNWDASTVTFKAVWTAASGSGGVAWSLQATSLADNDALDTTWGTVQTVTDTLQTATNAHTTAESSAITIGNTPAAGEYVQFRVTRTVGDAADTLGVDAKLIGIRIEYGVSAFSA